MRDDPATADAPPDPNDPAAAGSALVRAGRFFRRLGPTGPLALMWATVPGIAGITLLIYLGPISQRLAALGPLALWAYLGGFILLAGIGLLPTYAQAVLGGWCFKFALGFPAALSGFLGAALLGYAIARWVSRHRVEDMIAGNAKSRAVRDALIGHGFLKTLGIVALIRLNSPFSLTNLVMASAGVRLAPYALGTVIGLAPRTAAAVAIGAGLQGLSGDSLERPKWLVISGIAIAVVVVLVIGHIANRAIAGVTGHEDAGKAR